MTKEILKSVCEVEGFEPNDLVVQYNTPSGESRLHLPANAAMAWFRLKYPDGYCTLDESSGHNTVSFAAYKAVLFDGDGKQIGFPGFGSCQFGEQDDVHRNFIQSASTKAIACALLRSGFGTPIDAHYVEGVTAVIGGDAPETIEPVDYGVPVKAVLPPVPKAKSATKGSIETAQPKGIPEPKKPAENLPTTYEEALAFPIKSGVCAGKTMGEARAERGDGYVKYFIDEKKNGHKYDNTGIGVAARLIAQQEGI